MRVFITGGAGYIGGTVAQRLLEAGHQVTVYDSLVKGYLAAVPAGAAFIQGDILDPVALGDALAPGFDAILHFAALIEAGESMNEPGRFFRNNVAGSATLIQAAVEQGVQKIVFSSTAGIYASQDEPLSEDALTGPASVYGETKLMVEHMLRWYHQVHGLRYAALRYFNAAGAIPGRGEAHQPESHLIPLVLQVALGQRDHIAIFGEDYPTPDGSCIRDYIHIDDLASAHLAALTALDSFPQMQFNLGTGRGYSVKEVIETARAVTGHPIPAQIKARRPGDAARLVANAGAIRAALGWEACIPDLRDIIDSAWEWHRSHPHGYRES